MENLGNIYNENVFQINSNWLKSEDNQIEKGLISIDKEGSVQNVNEATSEIKKINKTTDLLHAKDLSTKERNKTNRFTSGRTWFRAMSNYCNPNLIHCLKNENYSNLLKIEFQWMISLQILFIKNSIWEALLFRLLILSILLIVW